MGACCEESHRIESQYAKKSPISTILFCLLLIKDSQEDQPVLTLSPPSALENNDTVLLTCSSLLAPGTNYSWLLNGVSLSFTSRHQLGPEEATVTISPVTRDDRGAYSCEGIWNQTRWRSDQSQLHVYYGPDKPSVTSNQRSNKTRWGSSLRLSCLTDSNPSSTYLWTVNSTAISNESDVLVPGLRAEQQGLYTCQVFNPKTQQQESSSVYVSVTEFAPLGFPQCSSKQQNRTHITLSCSWLGGGPPAALSWTGPPGFADVVGGAGELSITVLIQQVEMSEGRFTCVGDHPSAPNKTTCSHLGPPGVTPAAEPGPSLAMHVAVGVGVLGLAVLLALLIFTFLLLRQPS